MKVKDEKELWEKGKDYVRWEPSCEMFDLKGKDEEEIWEKGKD